MALSYNGYRALGTINPATGVFTELTGAGYARQAVTLVVDSSGAVTNTADITYGPATANWPQFSAVAVYDASTAGNLVLWYETNTPQTILSGSSYTVGANRMSLRWPVGGYTVHGTPIQLGKDVNVSGKTILVGGV